MARSALLATSNAEAAAQAVEALTAAGFHTYAAARTGMELARRGVMVSPVDQLAGQRSLLAGRVEFLQQRVLAGVVGRRNRPREAEALARERIHPVDVVVIRLPLQPSDLDPNLGAEDPAGAAEALRDGPYLAEAALLELALAHHHDVVPIVDLRGCEADIRAVGRDALPHERRRELARAAHQHLAAFRRFLMWTLDFEGAEEAPLPAPRRTTTAAISGGWAPVAPVGAGASGKPHGHDEDDDDDELGVDVVESASELDTGAARPGFGLPSELPRVGVVRLRDVPPEIGAAFSLHDLAGGDISADLLRDVAGAFAALRALGAPGVATARSGLACSLVRIERTTTRAVLRAVGVDPRAIDGGVLVAGGEIDLTAARVLAESEPTRALRTIVAAGFVEEAAELLQQRERRCIVLTLPESQPTHALESDAFGPYVTAIDDLRIRAATKAGAFADAAVLGVAALAGLGGAGATVVTGEGTLAIAGGHPHVADAVQIAVGKARKHATGATLVVTDALRDPPLLAWIAKAGVAAVVEVLGAPRSDDPAILAAARDAGVAFERVAVGV